MHISFPIVHGEPILQDFFGQQGASLVQFIEYLQEQKINTVTGLRTLCFPRKTFLFPCAKGAGVGEACLGVQTSNTAASP